MGEMMRHELESSTELPPQYPVGGVADLAEAPEEISLYLDVRPPIRTIFRAAK